MAQGVHDCDLSIFSTTFLVFPPKGAMLLILYINKIVSSINSGSVDIVY